MTKTAIRKECLERRLAMTDGEVMEASLRIHERLLAMPETQAARTIMTYLSFRKEVDTITLIHKWLSEGKRVCLPRTRREDVSITPYRIDSLHDDTEPGAFGLTEPIRDEARVVAPETIDLCLVPGLLFDIRRHRVGYGAGYYDRFLDRLSPTAATVGIAYHWQVVDRVPNDAWDRQLNYILTEETVFEPLTDADPLHVTPGLDLK